MGAEPWSYFTKYEADTSRALDRLRKLEFESGRYRYAEEAPTSIDEALEIADADGTASILDISQISSTPNFGCAAPFTASELQQYFGTDKPSRNDIESAEDHWDDLERGQGRYAVVYTNDQPAELYFCGYSYD